MAGGIGSRFWPISTPDYPKQFIDILGVGRTLIQLTFDRFRGIADPQNIWVVTNAKYVDIVREQLPEIPAGNILAEPAARNTAPCIAWACWEIRKSDAQANIVVTPSDAVVMDPMEFQRVINNALTFTANNNAIVTIGVKPNRPETGYGYVQYKDNDESWTAQTSQEPSTTMPTIHDVVNEIKKVTQFKEKPDRETATRYLAAGNYLWNAGIFVFNIDTMVFALTKNKPQIAEIMDRLTECPESVEGSLLTSELFLQCEKVSIDYAVMEPAAAEGLVYTHLADFGWSDLGNWQSLHEKLQKDNHNNASVGNVKFVNSSKNVVHMEHANRVILEGLDGYIVSENNGDFLICRRSEEQHIKEWN